MAGVRYRTDSPPIQVHAAHKSNGRPIAKRRTQGTNMLETIGILFLVLWAGSLGVTFILVQEWLHSRPAGDRSHRDT